MLPTSWAERRGADGAVDARISRAREVMAGRTAHQVIKDIRCFQTGITGQESEVVLQATGGYILVREGKVEVLLPRVGATGFTRVSLGTWGSVKASVLSAAILDCEQWKSARGDYTRSEDSEEECSGLIDSVIKYNFN